LQRIYWGQYRFNKEYVSASDCSWIVNQAEYPTPGTLGEGCSSEMAGVRHTEHGNHHILFVLKPFLSVMKMIEW
jgi:hypothetical protein